MMAMNAEAINSLSATAFAGVLKQGILDVIGTDYVILPRKIYEDMAEEYADRELFREAARRLASSGGQAYTEQEMMTMFGITEKDIAAVGDVEIE